MAISNAFDNINEFTNKKRVEQIVPAIGQALFKADCGFSGVQIGLAALAIYNALSVLPDMLCLVDSSQMVEYMSNAIEQVHRLNNDKKVHHIKQTPSELLAIVVALGWMEINNGVMHLTDKWIKFTTISSALSPSVEKIDQSKRRVKQVKHSKLSQPQLFKVALKSLEDTGYHVHRRIGETVNEVLIRFKQEYSKDSKKKMFKLLQEEMYVHKGSELLVGLPNLYSEYFADARGRLYHAACFGPNPQSGDMARAYYSHNVENWVEKGTQAYDIFMTELEDVAGKDRWLQPKMLRSVAERPADALWYICVENEKGNDNLPKRPLTYIRMALDWLDFEENGKCDSRLGFGEDAKCSGTQILAILAGDRGMLEATGFRMTEGKSDDPYVLCLANLKRMLKTSHLRHYINNEKMEQVLTRDFSKTPYMAVQYGCGVTALLDNKEFINALKAMEIPEEQHTDFIKITLAAVKCTLGERINHMVKAIQDAVNYKLTSDNTSCFSYKHVDGFQVYKPCYEDLLISEAFKIRFTPSTNVAFGNVRENIPWTTKGNEMSAEEFVRTFVVNYVQGIDALIART